MSNEYAELFADEVVTKALVRDVQMPDGAGTMALITMDNGFDHTKPNVFGGAGLNGMAEVFDGVRARADKGEIQAVGLTGKQFIFAVGADLTGVPKITQREQAMYIAELGHNTFQKLSDMPVPTFAFYNGAAMGGGVEIGLYCDYRTISAGVPAFALPECFLGLIPGWGGCTLLPNLIGLENALQVIIQNPMQMNKMLNGPKAAKLGIADVLLEPADFLEQSIIWAAGVLTGKVKVEREEVNKDEDNWNFVLDFARDMVNSRTGGHAPAPLAAIEVIRKARDGSREECFDLESNTLADLIMSDELRAGLYAFDLNQKRAKRPAGAPDKSLARKVTKVGIVGAGLMASQLALLFIRNMKIPVVMTDIDQERVDKGVGYVHNEIDKSLSKGRMTQDTANRYKALVTGAISKEGFSDAEFVIEAVFEEMGVKKQVWKEVEAVVSETCVLATNTSSLSITEMASELKHPERVVGFHFFNPVAVMPLLEVIKGEKTDDETLATAFAVGKSLKKTTILCKDSPSFIVNRLLGRYMSDMTRMVDEGTPIDVADQGFMGISPMPPFELLGLVGPAIAMHNNETLHAAFPDRFYNSPNLAKAVAAGKTRYYVKDENGEPALDPEVVALYDVPENPIVRTEEEIREKILEGLAEEARIMLDDGVVAAPMDIDLAMISGAGFTFWNGGITPLLDRSGISERITGKRFLPKGAASLP